MTGPLGAGKTTFVRGAAEALGVTEAISSPSFVIGRRYGGRDGDVSHLDLYRLGSLADEDPSLLDDYLSADAIAFVEWPQIGMDEIERVAAGNRGRLIRVDIDFDGADGRKVVID